ncbi:MAG: hypothetical protein ACOYNS_03360 [Bacteroidota bacterium]
MKTFLRSAILLLVILAFCVPQSSEQVWVKLEKGDALVLLPTSGQWQPISVKTEIPKRTFLLTKGKSFVKVFHATDMVEVPENCYVFVDDVTVKSKIEVVAELTRIEAEQLPNSDRSKDTLKIPDVGLTYGKRAAAPSDKFSIPYKTERLNMAAAFLRNDRQDGAVLTLKRMMTKYPSLYLDQTIVDQLFTLYERLGLDGFLFDESAKLIALYRNNDFSEKLSRWNTLAKQRLSDKK